MGTEIELFGEPAGFDLVELEFERLEALLSRFRPESQLSQLNREGRIEAAPDLLRVVELALAARERTGGLFDPTVHDALVA
ncbi:MAG TPA: FAD:protein FMN transferase, partial [Gaiellaceae bacterium]|nr:FAD:protein FMN transferase [Gaiellaceae bacterium]